MQKQIQNEIEEKQRGKKNPLIILFIIGIIILTIGIVDYAIHYQEYTDIENGVVETETATVTETETA